MGKESRKKLFTNQFDTDLNEDVTKVSAITMRFPKVPSTDSGDFKYKTYQPGQPVYGNITFEGVCHNSTFDAIRTWVKDCYNGAEIRKDLSINLREHQAETAARTFNLFACFPVAFNYVDIAGGGDNGAVMHWTLEVRVNRIEMA